MPKPSSEDQRAAGFTLIELLVVITIIGILLGLLLPAVQAAREAARRSQCGNNLHQVGIALQSYHAQFRVFPPGSRMHTNQGAIGIGWLVMILPFIEQTTVYDLIHPIPNGGGLNMPGGRQQLIKSYICPSAPPVDPGNYPSHYSGVSGPGRDDHRMVLEHAGCGDICTDGMFYPESHTRFSKILDGSSHTLAVGERVYFVNDWVSGSDWFGTPPFRFCTEASNNVTYPISGDLNQVGYYVSDPNAPTGAAKTMLKNDLLFGSSHPGIAMFCNADASVQTMRDSVDFTVFQDLSTIAGGETSHAEP